MTTRSTGEVATLLGATEPRLNDLIRRGKIAPAPPISAGRRLWADDDVARARAALGAIRSAGEQRDAT
jgi:hypothetical protein